MKYIKSLSIIICSLSFSINVSFAGPPALPHWIHEYVSNGLDAQPDWGGMFYDYASGPNSVAPGTYPYAECGIGTHQSPINLSGEVNTSSLNDHDFNSYLDPQYPIDTPDFFNTGHAAQVNVSTGYKGQLKIADDAYPLIQYHIHTPSEHVIGSQSFDGEIHFVHIRADGKMAVLGVLLKLGQKNYTIDTILANELGAGQHNPSTGIRIDPMSLLPHNTSDFYTYAGSLTTPPCSEGINWYVLAKPVEISQSQLSELIVLNNTNEGLPYNNRLTQPLNSRIVSGHIDSGNK
jgi:carbonic anhydrase